MSILGKKLRLERIMDRNTKRMVIIPMDHGVSDGPIFGIENIAETVNKVAEGGASAVLLHKGIINAGHRGYGRDLGLIMHLSAGTSLSTNTNRKVIVTSVEEAMKLGADAISIHCNVGAEHDADMLEDLGRISRECNNWGMPLLAMMYPRGPKITDQYDVEVVKFVARVGAELGADIVKTNYTGDPDSFKEVVRGCQVPVIIAGGPKAKNDLEFLKIVRDSLSVGGAGVAAGRNVFQHKNPTGMVKAITRVVQENIAPEEAIKEI